MSHNKNYSKFSQRKENTNLEEIFPEVSEDAIDDASSATQEIVEESHVTEEHTNVVGYVSDCECLRVRQESNVDSEVICIISETSEVVIDLDNSTDDFYKVKTSEGVEGYCMKKFIAIK